MRPCRQCRTPIENRDATCPHCGAAQDDAPKLNPDPPPPQTWRARWRQLLTDLSDITGLVPAIGLAILSIPLVVVGLIGYLVAGQTGTGIGVVAAIAILIGFAIWAESGG